jgi:hypothetical protein
MECFEALKQAEYEYARIDRAQDHLDPDSDGYVNLGPIVPWIIRRASELCGLTYDDVTVKYYSSEYDTWYRNCQGARQ